MVEFSQAFEGWLQDLRLRHTLRRHSSASVYADMWGAFVAWCLGQQPRVTLGELTVADLDRFVASRTGAGQAGALSPGHVWRMLRLIDRVLAHRALLAGTQQNTAAAELIASRPEVRQANLAESPLPDYLTADDASRLVVFLSSLRPRGSGPTVVHSWQELRNGTSVALQLGAGLTPGEVRALTVDAPVVAGGRQPGLPWKVVVPGDGNRPPRESPVAPWAGQLLKHWLAVRAQVGFAADAAPAVDGHRPWLFPGTRKGRQWSKVAQYDAAKQVLEQAGIQSSDGGSFRLRHTFALRQLRRGKGAAEVARWMGIADPMEMERYQRILLHPEDVA
ncbi:tyrosine-type recombinase/integrase [Eleftheria terrae]|uniref:tyrosine-type recombinase/integrase n=1 Tax=Eleftheria terrae TaxID=1597781 RepID=UPI00263AD7AE|nr:site-specific integrase [Eleftheria terrae]WKB55869.1 site-specific integrase [Eleftheria terrae]